MVDDTNKLKLKEAFLFIFCKDTCKFYFCTDITHSAHFIYNKIICE